VDETRVAGLEWWLEAHMDVVGELAWLEQRLEMGDGGAHAPAMYLLLGDTEAVRDALYELYCDAADPRMARLLGAGAPLEQHVRCSYAWCGRVVSLLASLVQGLQSEEGPDWAAAKASFKGASDMYVGPSEGLTAEIRALAIDTASPTEPLRNLPADLSLLFEVSERLQRALTDRFG
jgi:hypothetical protein